MPKASMLIKRIGSVRAISKRSRVSGQGRTRAADQPNPVRPSGVERSLNIPLDSAAPEPGQTHKANDCRKQHD